MTRNAQTLLSPAIAQSIDVLDAVALPSGPLGVWAFDRYTASGGPHIPNLIAGGGDLVVAGGGYAGGAFTGYGSINLGAPRVLNAWTIQCQVSVAVINTYNLIVFDTSNYNNFGFHSASILSGNFDAPGWPENLDVMRCGYGAGVPGGSSFQGQRGGLWDLRGQGMCVLTLSADGTTVSSWIDDIELFQAQQPFGAKTLQNLSFGISPEPIQSAQTYGGFLSLWPRALTPAEIRNSVAVNKSRASSAGLAVPSANRVLVIEGDSNHGQNSATCWPWLFGAHAAPKTFGAAYSIAGSRVTDMVARAPAVDAVLPPSRAGREFNLTIGIGTNDIGDTATYPTTAAWINAARAYGIARKAAGYTKIAIFTIPPRADISGSALATFQARRATINADIRANYPLYGADAVIDIAADPIIGPDNSYATNPSYWQGGAQPGLHFSDTGNALVETIVRPVINGF